MTLSACAAGSLSLWERNGSLCECFFFFMRELGFIWILNSQRVFLALSVLSEDRCVQRSVQVVVHGRDVHPAIGKHQHHTSRRHTDHSFFITEDKSDLLVLLTSFWCSVKTRSLVSGGMKTKSMEASSSRISLRGGLGEPKSSFVCGAKHNENQLFNG